MRILTPIDDFADLLVAFDAAGGVLDYVLLESDSFEGGESLHREAAILGMSAIEDRIRERFRQDSEPGRTFQNQFHLESDPTRAVGRRVEFSEFWGTDDVRWKPLGRHIWKVPDANGYKTAFFLPPHGLDGDRVEGLFDGINRVVLGDAPTKCEIYSWSTDWSNYFDDGLEWWGAFYWTVHQRGSRRVTVIAGSVTD